MAAPPKPPKEPKEGSAALATSGPPRGKPVKAKAKPAKSGGLSWTTIFFAALFFGGGAAAGVLVATNALAAPAEDDGGFTSPPTTPSPTMMPTYAPVDASFQVYCSDSCVFANDGECDDGESGSVTSACAYGTDCSDCAPRANSNLANYSIELVYRDDLSGLTPALKTSVLQAFQNAQDKWASVLYSTPGTFSFSSDRDVCGQGWYTRNATDPITDVLILVEIVAIDGVSGTLGSAGPCSSISRRALTGRMRFDEADVDVMSQASLERVILHEMGHVLGIGTFWDNIGVSDESQSPNLYSGVWGIDGFRAVGGGAAARPFIEEDGGSGTAGGHWDDVAYEDELMTGYLSSGSNPLSVMTVRSLRDMGYTVKEAAADAYTVPTRRRLRGARLSAEEHAARGDLAYGDDIDRSLPQADALTLGTVSYD